MNQNELIDEIDLRGCIDAIVKRKKLILTVFFISAIVTAVITYATPRNYEISMIVEPGTIGRDNSRQAIFVDSPNNVKEMIGTGTFDLNVMKALELNPQKAAIKLKISQPRNSTFLKIGIDEPENKKELGIKILNQLLDELINFYKKIVEAVQGDIDKEIAILSKLNNQLADIKIMKNEPSGAIESLRNSISTTEIKIEKLKSDKANVSIVRLIQAPRVSLKSVCKIRMQKIIPAGIIGLILGTFLAVFIEYWEKSKKEPS